ncbi:hypothetical protein CEXT_108571 [Caerostris extrusa]|uniref:Uncharacterized protein n=1 Tax=Caerostris extrusa TaxID=172846 RepID=A0AAV4VM75_CAEEX|nr:hypothetical protein CEXT_108571 [Caerostris extrusa]
MPTKSQAQKLKKKKTEHFVTKGNINFSTQQTTLFRVFNGESGRDSSASFESRKFAFSGFTNAVLNDNLLFRHFYDLRNGRTVVGNEKLRLRVSTIFNDPAVTETSILLPSGFCCNQEVCSSNRIMRESK